MVEEHPVRDENEVTLKVSSVASACPTCGLKLAEGSTICPSDGTILDNNDSMMQRIKETYEILEVVNSGGMGVIYKARHRILQKLVAIKMLKPGHFHEAALVRFQREGKIAAALSHPNIVAINDFGVTEFGQPFMVMEFVKGVSLADKIREKGSLSIEETQHIAMQVCEALKHAHEHGILHRDVKPTNIMLVDGSSSIKVVDFGIAKFIEPGSGEMSLTETGASLGSPLYMSPEQSTGKKLDGRADLYSLGCVLFECLTGTPPFVGKSAVETIMMHVSGTVPSLREASLGRTFPANMETLVASLLDKDPDKRFQTAAETLKALGELDHSSPNPSVTETKTSNRILPVVWGCALCLIAAAVSMVFLTRKPPLHTTKPEEPAKSVTAAPTPASAHNIVPAKETADLAKYERGTSIAAFMSHINSSDLFIDASGYDLRDEDLEALKEDQRLNAIRVNDTKITDVGMGTLGKLERLVTLSANHTRITDAGIAKISHLPNLETLHVSENRLTNAAAAPISKLKKLTDLTLCDTLFSDQGIKKISGLRHIRKLQLNRTLVADAGVKVVVDNFPDLEELHARSNKGITARSLKYLEGAHKLRRLTLSDCNILPQEMRAFLKAHPKIQEITNAPEKMIFEFTAP